MCLKISEKHKLKISRIFALLFVVIVTTIQFYNLSQSLLKRIDSILLTSPLCPSPPFIGVVGSKGSIEVEKFGYDFVVNWILSRLIFGFQSNNNGEHDRETEGDEHFCIGYRNMRSHVRIESLQVDANWWIKRSVIFKGMSLHSDPSNIRLQQLASSENEEDVRGGDSRPINENFAQESIGKGKGLINWLDNLSYQLSGYIGYDNVLRMDAITSGDPVTTTTTTTSTPIVPMIEIDQLKIHWNSWNQPVIDTYASGIRINFVVDTASASFFFEANQHDNNNSNKDNDEINSASTRKHLLPPLLIGNATIEDALRMMPLPPDEEGTFPRHGIVNVTDVKVVVTLRHKESQESKPKSWFGFDGNEEGDSEGQKEGITVGHEPIMNFTLPDDLFHPLLEATIEASPEGIDMINFPQTAEKTLGDGVRNAMFSPLGGNDVLQQHWNNFFHDVSNKVQDLLNGDWNQRRKNLVNNIQQLASEQKISFDRKVLEMKQNVDEFWKEHSFLQNEGDDTHDHSVHFDNILGDEEVLVSHSSS